LTMPSNMYATSLVALPRFSKRLLVMTLDVVLAVGSVWLAFCLRIEQFGLPVNQQVYVYLLAPALAKRLVHTPSCFLPLCCCLSGMMCRAVLA